MIKRLFYKHEHGDRDVPSDSDSSSDSELEAKSTEEEIEEEEEEEEEEVVAEVRQNNGHCSSSSGYESEDSSAHEVDLDSTGLPTNENDLEIGEEGQYVSENHSFAKGNSAIVNEEFNTKADKDEIPSDVSGCVLKTKSVFKCKLCPRIVCLTEETLGAHLKSKRHARSEKLLSEGRLKLMLNSDGEIETGFEEEETHQERHASTLAAAQSCQNSTNSRKKNKGRQRQRKRVKKKTGEDLESEDTKSTKKPLKKRRKSNN